MVPRDNASNLHLAALADGGVVVFGQNSFGVQSKDDMFLTRFSPSGELLWHKPATGRAIRSAAVRGDYAFFASEFVGSVLLDGVRVSQGGANTSVFLGRLGIDGTTYWGRLFDTADFDRVSQVVALPDGGAALAQGVFAPITGKFAVPAAGGEDAVITRWSASGELSWVRNLGWPGNDTATGLQTDEADNLYVAGTRWKSASTYVDATESGPCWPWVAKLGPNGDVIWQIDLGSRSGHSTLSRLARAPDGRLVAAGKFRSQMSVGSIELTTKREAAYIAQLSPEGGVEWAHVVPALSSLAVDAFGRILFANKSGVFVEHPSEPRTQILAFAAGAILDPVECTLLEPGRLFVTALAPAPTKLGSRSLPKPATVRFPHMPNSEQTFVARISY